MSAKKIIGRLLLAFVLVSIGFAAGRQTAGRHPPRAETLADGATTSSRAAPNQPATAEVQPDRVVVYYMHATFRCITCDLVESLAGELIQEEFAPQVQAGLLEWHSVNYQEAEDLASRYDVGGNMIVVARFRGAQEVDRRRLDRVMELVGRPEEFKAYVRGGILELLEPRV